MAENPDEYFEGNHDWYYSGGPMDVTEIDGKQLIFHITGEDRNILSMIIYIELKSTRCL